MQKKNILFLLSVVILSSVVGCGNVENTMAESENIVSSVESTEIVESSIEEQSTSEVLDETGGKVNYDRGESKGEAIINKVEESETVETEAVDMNGGEGSSAIVLEEQPTTEPESTVENSISDLPEIPNYSAEFYSQDNTGKYVFTEKFYTMVLSHPYFAGATVEEVSDYYNENDFYLVDLQFGELDAFDNCLNNAYNREGQPYLDEVVQSTPSTSTETQSQTQTGQNTTPSQSTTNNSTSNTTEEEPEYIEWKPSENLGDGGNLVGNTVLH